VGEITARETALRVLRRLEESDLYADWALDSALRRARLHRRDRALVTELVNGVMRWRRYLDGALDHLLKGTRTVGLTPWIRNILRLGIYQILFLDKIPAAAATHESVSLAKKFGHTGTASLVNAVLRNAIRAGRVEPPYPPLTKDPVGHIGMRYSQPDWMVRRWLKRYGQEETIALCQANNQVPDVVVRVNPLKATVSRLREDLLSEGVTVVAGSLMRGYLHLKGVGDIRRLKAFRQGWLQVQDESAGLALLLLAPEPGEVILDLCSAPGGKTAHMAGFMGDRGLILAVDRHERRLRDLVDNCRRLGISSARPFVADGKELWVRPVDRVLVDAPCSGLGVLARRVDLRWRKKGEDIPRLVQLQLQLLMTGANVLKPGGVLVYSTCTIEDEENEEVVARLLAQRDDLRLERAASLVPDETVTENGFVRTFPHRDGLDGTFGARMRKVKGGNFP
jgi:16S rRNA (cytosine967-C5)-methyltransferase